ncbi:MAG TPA: hypothetical protein VLE54_00140, partial [Thermoanaerobaculia bacterium]|nr:hypothetical protein [Thermoanaerobaculia bacterium]
FDADMRRLTQEIDRSGDGSPAARSRAFAARAITERRRDLAGWGELFLRKAWDWLRPYPSPMFWPPWVVIGAAADYVLLFSLAGVGLARASRAGVRTFALAFLAVTMMVHVLIIVVWRYRIPYWDPVLILYSVFAAGTLLPGWKLSTRPA